MKGDEPFTIEVRASAKKLKDATLENFNTGDIITIDKFKILRSGANDLTSGKVIPEI